MLFSFRQRYFFAIFLFVFAIGTGRLSLADSRDTEFTAEEQAYLAENPKLRVHVEKSWPPFNFIEFGEIKGYVNEYLLLMAEKSGIQIEFVTGHSWDQYMDMLRNHDIDVISNMKITPDRKQFALFSERQVVDTLQSIVTKETNRHLADLDRIAEANLNVAVVRGYFQEELLKRHYPQVNLLLTHDIPESIEQVIAGNAVAAIGAHAVFDYHINKLFYSSLANTPITDNPVFAASAQHMGIRNDRPMLKNIIDKAMSRVSDEDTMKLRRKWLGEASGHTTHAASRLEFSSDEREFLAGKEYVSMCIDPDWMPLEAIRKGKHVGMTAEFFHLFEQRLGIPIRLVNTENWSQSVEFAKARKCDIFSLAMETPSRKEYMDFSEPYMRIPLVLATQDSELFVPDVSSITDRVLGIVKDYAFAELLKNKYPHLKIVDVASVEDGLRQVERGEIFGFVGTLTTVGHALQSRFPELKIAGKFDDLWELGVGVRNDQPLLLSTFDKAIASLPPEKHQEILNNWISVRYDQPFDYSMLWKSIPIVLLIIGGLLYRQHLLKLYNRRLEQLSHTDPLTGCANRLKLDDFLHFQINNFSRYQQPFSVILCDLDRFKQVNDKHGHIVGDKVLIDFVNLVSRHIRGSDILGRWGGEEFLIVCPHTDATGAFGLAELVRTRVNEHHFHTAGQLTASFGVAEFLDTDLTASALIQRADGALYESKNDGRNRITLSGGPTLEHAFPTEAAE